MKHVWNALLIRSVFKRHSPNLQKKEHICSFMPSKLHELVREARRNYRDIVKTGISTVGSHKKLTCHVAKLRARAFDCGLKPPCCATGQAVCVNTLQRPVSSGWLPGPSDLAEPAPSVSGWSTDWLASWLLGWLKGYMTGWVNDWLATQVGS